MTATFSQIETWIKNTDAYSSGVKEDARDGLYKAFRELVSEAAEVPHLKKEIDRLIQEKVALDVQLREAKAQWTIPPVSPTPPLPYNTPGVRTGVGQNTLSNIMEDSARIAPTTYPIPHTPELGGHPFVPDPDDPDVCGLVTDYGAPENKVPMICGFYKEDH